MVRRIRRVPVNLNIDDLRPVPFDEMIVSGKTDFDMTYLKDRNREMILILLDKVAATGDQKYIPILEAWKRIDYKKVRQKINGVINKLQRK